MNKLLKCVRDAACGALFVSVAAVGFIGAVEVVIIKFADRYAVDRQNDLQRLPDHLLFAAVAGLVLGAFAGLSSRLTEGRVSFVRCVLVIGICMAVGRLSTFPRFKTADPTEIYVSYAVTAAAATLGAAVVFLWGIVKKRLDARASVNQPK